MKSSKKLLSFFLAVVMVFSVLTVMASAYTVGGEEAVVNYKYTVEKVSGTPETAAGSAAYTGDNIYAVTLWMKASKGVDVINTALHYNKALFSPITLSDGDVTYPAGAGLNQDTYATDMGESTIYAYTLGDYMNNTGMYNATGGTAATKALAKCIGIGNANADQIRVTAELVSPDHALYSKWGANLPADTGVLSLYIDVVGNTKTAYLNTIEGINLSTDYAKMITVYFESIAADVNGAEFGIFTDNCYTVDGNVDGTGSAYFKGATSYVGEVPTINVSENAKVEAEKLVYHVKNQIQWADKDAKTVNVGVVAGFDVEDIAINFNDKGTSTDVTAVGAKVTINGKDDTNTQRFVYEMNDGASYYFRAVVENVPADYEGDIVVTPFVEKGNDTFEGDPVTITAEELAKLVAKLPA